MCDSRNGTCHCGEGHTHNGSQHSHVHLSDIRSSVQHELMGKDERITDSKEVLAAKENLNIEGKTIDNYLALTSALCLQLRYNEVIDVCKEALSIEPNNFKVKRLLALRYLTTGHNDEALALFTELKAESFDPLDIAYRLGLCQFYKGNYTSASDLFLEGINYCQDRPEMYIACLYWYLFCLVELKKDITPALKLYHEMDVGHHVGYLLAVELFLGKKDEDLKEQSKSNNLTRIMYLFGLYHYYLYTNESLLAKKTFDEGIACDEYWASFSGMGFWNIFLRNKTK